MTDNKKIYLKICAVCAVLVLLELIFTHGHGPAWRSFPGASIIIAFVGGWALIILSKKILGPLLQRKNSYYEDLEEGDEKDD